MEHIHLCPSGAAQSTGRFRSAASERQEHEEGHVFPTPGDYASVWISQTSSLNGFEEDKHSSAW